MSNEKIELRKEVYDFMEKQGHELKLTLDGNAIPYGIVNHLIAAFHEYKMEELSKFQKEGVSNTFDKEIPLPPSPPPIRYLKEGKEPPNPNNY